jgi:Fe-S cluster assembly iron-binding protein IscA
MIAVTDLALEKIQEILKEETDENLIIRVNVSPG